MEKIMVVVFDDETKAHEGIRALKKLDSEGSVSIHSGALIRKGEDNAVEVVPDSELEGFPVGTLAGSFLGGTIGLLGGPAGAAAAATIGGITGFGADMVVGTVDDDLINEVTRQLEPGKSAVVLDLSEDWITPVDADLEPFSRTIIRRLKVDVEDQLVAKRIEADQKEMEAFEQEWSKAREDQKARIHARMEELRDRIRRHKEQLTQRRDRARSDNQAKLDALKKKIASSRAERKERHEAWIDELKREDQRSSEAVERSIADLKKADHEFTERVGSKIAGGLRKAAAHFEPKKTA
jgi:uncharacterized membrane protein